MGGDHALFTNTAEGTVTARLGCGKLQDQGISIMFMKSAGKTNLKKKKKGSAQKNLTLHKYYDSSPILTLTPKLSQRK